MDQLDSPPATLVQVRGVQPGATFAHAGNTELHYITEGAGTLSTGGTIFQVAGGTATTYKS